MVDTEDISFAAIKKPSLFWLVTEAHRALFEFGTFFPYKFFKHNEQTGDGHPVLVLPGFMATDVSTAPLRSFLKRLGYTPFGWGAGRNYANAEYLDLLVEKVEDIYLTHRAQVSIIGWSLGGVFAREIAKRKPNLVRQIITLGSPFAGVTEPNNAMWLYEMLTDGRGTEDVDPELLNSLPLPAPVPTTAIYSKEDGVVPWETCMELVEDELHQNIQVRGSHLGLGVNPSVLEIIKDRLQLSEKNWTHFVPSNVVEDKIFYPSITT